MILLGLNDNEYFPQYEFLLDSSRKNKITEEHKEQVKTLQQILVNQFSELGAEDDDWHIGYEVNEAKYLYGKIFDPRCFTMTLFDIIENVFSRLEDSSEWIFHCSAEFDEDHIIDEFFYNDGKVYFFLNENVSLDQIIEELE